MWFLKFSPVWLRFVVSDTLLPEQSCPRVEVGTCFGLCPPHTADALKRVWQGSSCSVPHPPPSFSIPALSLPSITPDCIWQMPLLAPYHQVQWRQPKTILLCPYTTSVLHFAWLTHLVSARFEWGQGPVSGTASWVAIALAKGSPGECFGHGF